MIKKSIILIIIGVVTAGIIILGVYFMFFHNHSNESIGKSVTDIESINLRMSGMRITEEYEIKTDGDKAEISYYTVSYSSGQDKKVLRKRTVCDTVSVIDALNSFNFVSWNGFHGEHPKGVLDGTMFSLKATLNGGHSLYADGSENFPKHFNEFEHWLYEILKDCEEIEVS